MKFFLLFLGLSASSPADPYSPKALKVIGLEQMKEMLSRDIKAATEKLSEDKSAGGEEAAAELKKSLKSLLIRPDTDSAQDILISRLKSEIIKYKPFMPLFQELVEEALAELKAQKKPPEHQAGLLYLIENSLSYLRTENSAQSSAILQIIKKADIEISDEISAWLLLEMGRGKSASPSYLAGLILDKRKKAAAERKAQEREREAAQKEKAARDPSAAPDKAPVRIEL